MATTTETATNVASFLEGFAGQGLETIDSGAMATAYLGMVQPDSTPTMNGHAAGTWRNSATDENYGNVVRVVPVAFKVIWSERSSTDFKTVARYEPNSIPVETKPVPAGKRGYPKMINPQTGNEVQELFCYAVVLTDHPEAGVLLFSPTAGSMKACKAWNSQLRGQLLPNGAPAPIFAYSWNLALDLVQNPAKPTTQIAKLVSVKKDSLVSEELFKNTVQPQLASVNSAVLAITQGDIEEEE